MSNLLTTLFSGPVLPGTILLGVCLAYWLLMIAGAVDLDLIDLELDSDAPVDAGGSSWGLTALKFLNINDVPLMIWLTIFAIGNIAAAILLDGGKRPEGIGPIAAVIVRNAAIGLAATKLLTQPLRGKFETVEPNKAETLIGRTCVVTTGEVSDRAGQARVDSHGAPLLLNVRGPAGTLNKNDVAVIVGYDDDRHLFLIEPIAAPSEPACRETV
ncbi:MAG: hypothetical protein WBC44_12150 [Planctomycetaceae bacterium]